MPKLGASHASRGQVEVGLSLQKRFVAYALVLATGLAPLLPLIPAAAAAESSAAIPVSARDIANAKLQTICQAKEIVISPTDVARGQAIVSAALRFSVVTNKGAGYHMLFHPVGNHFESVRVDGLGHAVHLGAD
jgi:hypothetical protein